MIDKIYLTTLTRRCFVFAALFFSLQALAQTSDSSTYYFDGEWDLCDSNEAIYYRRCIWKDKKLAAVDYYLSTHTPQMIGYFADKGGSIQTDTAMFFSIKGSIKKTGRYLYDKADGLWITYFDSGMKDSEGSFTNGKKNGEWVYFHPNGIIGSLEIYENDTMKRMRCWDDQGIALSDCYENRLPEFPGGEEKYLEFIRQNITYPSFYREQGINGRVVVQFVVDTTGVLTDYEILYSTKKAFATEALRVVQLMPPWKVYPDHNRNIPVTYRIPFVFRLN